MAITELKLMSAFERRMVVTKDSPEINNFAIVEERLERIARTDGRFDQVLGRSRKLRRVEGAYIVHTVDSTRHLLAVAGFDYDVLFSVRNRVYEGVETIFSVEEQRLELTPDVFIARVGLQALADTVFMAQLRQGR